MNRKTPWRDGYIVLNYTSDVLLINAMNNSVEARPRTIVISRFKNYIEAISNRKYIYIYFPEELKPFTNEGGVSLQEIRLEFYDIKYTRIDYDEYYTVILPGFFLYDYIVLTSDEIAVAMSIKRRVFYERIDSRLVLYIV